MTTRQIPSSLLALIVTLGLILAMYGLIRMDEPDLSTKKVYKLPDFAAEPKNEDLQTITPKPERPEEVQEQPDLPKENFVPKVDINAELNLGVVKLGLNPDLKGFNNNDGEYLPIFRAPPIYPKRAAERGLCGWVELMFTVTASGGVRDPIVTDSSNRMFERNAIKSALKYKYKPRQQGGKPVDVGGVELRITFEIEGGC